MPVKRGISYALFPANSISAHSLTWRLLSCGIWCRVAWLVLTDVLEDCTRSVFSEVSNVHGHHLANLKSRVFHSYVPLSAWLSWSHCGPLVTVGYFSDFLWYIVFRFGVIWKERFLRKPEPNTNLAIKEHLVTTSLVKSIVSRDMTLCNPSQNQPTLRRSIWSPSSGPKSKPNKLASCLLRAGFLLGLFVHPDCGGDVLLQSVGRISPGNTACYPRRQPS
jgi:hypothetical protein